MASELADTVEAAARAEAAALKDDPPADSPPTKRGPGRPKKSPAESARRRPAPGRPPKAKPPKLAPQIAEFVSMAGLGLMAAGTVRVNPKLSYDGQILCEHAEELAQAAEDLGKKYPAVQRVLEALVAASELGRFAGVVVKVAVPISANHGLLPAGTASLLGAPAPPDAGDERPDDQPDLFGNGLAGAVNLGGPG